MKKPLFVISSPFDTMSGYGARSRDIIKAIIELDKYEVKLIAQPWGSTSWGFCKENDEWKFLLNHLLFHKHQKIKPDIWMQITIPSEFKPMGKFNIGCTAGIESTICKHEWLQGMNRMDYNFVSSNFSKQTFENSKYRQHNKISNQIRGELKLEKPIKVIFEGANLDTYQLIKWVD